LKKAGLVGVVRANVYPRPARRRVLPPTQWWALSGPFGGWRGERPSFGEAEAARTKPSYACATVRLKPVWFGGGRDRVRPEGRSAAGALSYIVTQKSFTSPIRT